MLATGDGHQTLGSYLGDPNMEVLGGGVVSALRGLELLETEIALAGGGMVHVAPATATAMISANLLTAVRGVMQTYLGTPVAVGAGYIGVTPDGEASPAADQEWAFASGPIQIYRGDSDRAGQVRRRVRPRAQRRALHRGTSVSLQLDRSARLG